MWAYPPSKSHVLACRNSKCTAKCLLNALDWFVLPVTISWYYLVKKASLHNFLAFN